MRRSAGYARRIVIAVTYKTEERGELEWVSRYRRGRWRRGTHGLLLRQITRSSQDDNDGVVLQLEVSVRAKGLASLLRKLRSGSGVKRAACREETRAGTHALRS